MKKIEATYKANSLFEIDISFFKKEDIEYIFTDLDNTLDSFKEAVPSQKTIELIKKFKDNDIKVVICSNNSKKRVSKYAKILNIDFIYYAKKPSNKILLKYINKNNIKKDKIVFVGDQYLTDIKVANKSSIKSIFVKELVNENGFFTHFNKFFEKVFHKFIISEKNTIDWRDI